MKRFLLAATIAAIPQVSVALPPPAGVIHTFTDPVFAGSIVCDTIEQVRSIATAERPERMFLEYYATPNERAEPTCAAAAPTGLILDVKLIGTMIQSDRQFHAYAVEVQFGSIAAFVLYLEPTASVRA